ncbi:MAG: hypothetical protein GY868_18315, partial [Deltaproteobacteria bacterium]|nr:hypothetical protein [Deltaproteobacteria bacterium]
AEAHHELYAIWGTAPDHLIAVGFNTVLQYNGRHWSSVGSGLPYQDWFHAVWGHSSSSFYARTFEHGETLFFRNNSPKKGPAGIILAEHPFAKEDVTRN